MSASNGFRVQGSGFGVVAQNPEPRTQNGQSLILVLWIMGLAGLAIGALTMRATHELRLGQVPQHALQRAAIAQAAVHQAIAVLQHDDPASDHLDETWATGVDEDTQQQLLLEVLVGAGGFSVGVRAADGLRVGMIDEERKLHLNTTALGRLQRLIELVAFGEADAERITQAIGDWRDEPAGPLCAGASPACHNGPFETVDELRLVPGMTPQLFAALEPYVTVYGTGAVNANTATAIVLTAMGYDGDAVVAQRATQVFDAANPPPPGLVTTSSAFTIPAESVLTDGTDRAHLSAVIDRAGCELNAPEQSRCILAWLPQHFLY